MPAFAHEPAFRIVLVTVFCWPIVADQESRVSGIICVRERQVHAGNACLVIADALRISEQVEL